VKPPMGRLTKYLIWPVLRAAPPVRQLRVLAKRGRGCFRIDGSTHVLVGPEESPETTDLIGRMFHEFGFPPEEGYQLHRLRDGASLPDELKRQHLVR